MAERDLLFLVRNNYYLGAYQTVINEAADLENIPDSEQIERDCYVYRAYIALGSYELVIKEVNSSSPMALQAVKLLAQYMSGKLTKDAVLSTLSEWLGDSACNRNPQVLLSAGMIYAQEGNFVEALKCCNAGTTLEMHALCVQVLIKMDRVDKAEQEVKVMSSIDDDATITQLAGAWVGVALGGAKVQEASYVYQELGDKYNWTANLYTGRAVCSMKMSKWEEAEQDLLEALNRDGKDANTLSNLITVALHLGKNPARYVSQLKLTSPSHPYVKRLDAGEELFARAAASMA